MITDPYRVLGIERSATDEEITKVYRKLAKKYHPDLNPGDETAAEKMSEINAAYDMIRNHEAPAQSAASGGQTYTGTQWTSASSADGYTDPFEAFFRQFAGFYTGAAAGGADDPYARLLQSARVYINAQDYVSALNVLNSVPQRSAEWYYLSAVANFGAGNRTRAYEHAEEAVRLEPNNLKYTRLLERMEAIRSGYTVRSEAYGRPRRIRLGPFSWMCIFNLAANLIARLLGVNCGGVCC